MATPRELIDEQAKLHAEIAARLVNAPTGVAPGYHAALGGTVDQAGRLRYVGGGGAKARVWQALLTSPQTVPANTRAVINFNGVALDPPDDENPPHFVTGANWAYTPHVGSDLLLVGIRVEVSADGHDWEAGEGLRLSWGKVGVGLAEERELIDFYRFEADQTWLGLPSVTLHGVTMLTPFIDRDDAVYCAYLDNRTSSDRVIRIMGAVDGAGGTKPSIWIMRLAGALDF